MINDKRFSGCGSRIITSSVTENKGIDEIREVLQNKTTALAGPSGVGKSSILNSVSRRQKQEPER